MIKLQELLTRYEEVAATATPRTPVADPAATPTLPERVALESAPEANLHELIEDFRRRVLWAEPQTLRKAFLDTPAIYICHALVATKDLAVHWKAYAVIGERLAHSVARGVQTAAKNELDTIACESLTHCIENLAIAEADNHWSDPAFANAVSV